MTTYTIAVTYAAGNVQEHAGLSADDAQSALGAFSRDLLSLRGAGVTSVSITLDVVAEKQWDGYQTGRDHLLERGR